MSWQPGDVSVDARRAAEAAAEAAGVPLKEWFAETVRAAIIRELGSLSPEEATGPQPAPGPRAPEAQPELALSRSTATSYRTPEPADEPPPPEPIIAAEPPAPPPIVEPEPEQPAPAPMLAAEPPPSAPIAEPEPPAPPMAAAVTPAQPVEPAPRVAPDDTRAAADARRPGISLGVQRLTDTGLSGWLASRIQGLSTTAAPSTASAPVPTAAPTPSPAMPPLRPRFDLGPSGREPPPLARQSPPPALAPPAPVAPAAAQPAPGSSGDEKVLPLSLPAGPVTTLPLASLRPARIRARRPSDVDVAITLLAGSVASQGVREPILVRRLAEKADQYEVVAGERRRLASERAGRVELPAVIVTADDTETLMLSLAENLGRGDFSPLDEARSYLRLLTEYRVSPSALAQRLARERSHIALALRLLGLPPKVRQLIDSGRLAGGQAYALLGSPDPEAMADQMIHAAAPLGSGVTPPECL